ncbi:MAG: hypothetical protein F4X34_00430 [Chloroflexi bacterium]|nr:hypothetical protein [Chloroflexota bacterium]
MLDYNLSHSESDMTEERAIVNKILSAGSGEAPGPDAPQLSAPADSQYINSVLNSALGRWFARQLHLSNGESAADMPMPRLKAGERQELIDLVNEIATLSEAERLADERNTVLALNDLILDFYELWDDEEGVIYAAFDPHTLYASGDGSEEVASALRGGDAR